VIPEVNKRIDVWNKYMQLVNKIHVTNIPIKVITWNVQSLNDDYKTRKLKIDFIIEITNIIKPEVIFLVDVNKDKELLGNSYKKYWDGRNILLVRFDIIDEVKIFEKELAFKMNKANLAFIYLIPGKVTGDQVKLLKKWKSTSTPIFGDFNLRTNKAVVKEMVEDFFGEDGLQVGVVNHKYRIRKLQKIYGPSDHRVVVVSMVNQMWCINPLKLQALDYKQNYKALRNILLLNTDNDIRPIVSRRVVNIRLSDEDEQVNYIYNNFISSKIENIYQKFNYIWKGFRREPYLGEKVPEAVYRSFKDHLKVNNFKSYKVIEDYDIELSEETLDLGGIKHSYSNAITIEGFPLWEISRILIAILNEADIKSKNISKSILNYVFAYLNRRRDKLICRTFFLLKDRKLQTYRDVRMITILPLMVKVYETLIYNEVMNDIKSVVEEGGRYQFGGLQFGSTFETFIDVRSKFLKNGCKALLFIDIEKGYDNVDLNLLEKAMDEKYCPLVGRTKRLIKIWIRIVNNMDMNINGKRVKRTIGIPMGLTLSPCIFVLYTHLALCARQRLGIDGLYDQKQRIRDLSAIYIDDITLAVKENGDKSFEDFNFIKNSLKLFNLKINDVKCHLITKSGQIKKQAEDLGIEVIDNEKMLGRELMIDCNNELLADDRCLFIKSAGVKGIPKWTPLGARRILFSGAIDAKIRYKAYMHCVQNVEVRSKIVRRAWNFFAPRFEHLDYASLVFIIQNYFRYFLSAFELQQLLDEVSDNKGKFKSYAAYLHFRYEIIKKLRTGVEAFDDALFDIEFPTAKRVFKIIDDKKNKQIRLIEYKRYGQTDFRDQWSFTKEYLDLVWKQFQEKMIENRIKRKKEKNERISEHLGQILKSKIGKNFGFVVNLANGRISEYNNKKEFVFRVCGLIALKVSKFLNDETWSEDLLEIDDEIAKQGKQIFNVINVNRLWEKIEDFLKVIVDLEELIKYKREEEQLKRKRKNILRRNVFKKIFFLFSAIEEIDAYDKYNGMPTWEIWAIFRAKIAKAQDTYQKQYDCFVTNELMNGVSPAEFILLCYNGNNDEKDDQVVEV